MTWWSAVTTDVAVVRKDDHVTSKHTEVPSLLLGFDTETTGLSTNSERAVSYGFIAYRDGVAEWSDHFFVLPDVPLSPGAERVHGLSLEVLRAKYEANEALSVGMGLIRAVATLRKYHREGAWIVGANVARFDIAMLASSYESVLKKPLSDEGLDPSELRIIDVIQHDTTIESRRENPRRRSLTHLCEYYDVEAGGHDALGDARAAVDVFLSQVARNTNDWTSIRPAVGAMSSDDVDTYFDR